MVLVTIKKTKHMAISLRPVGDPVDHQLRLHTCGGQGGCVTCESVECVTTFKYLGVVFDNCLKWSAHVQEIKQRLRRFIYVFSTLSRVLEIDLLKTVYCAHVQSILQYGILAWGGGYQSIIQPLSVTQKSIIKAALHKPRRYSSDSLFNEFKVFNLTQLFIRSLVLYIFKNPSDIYSTTTHNYRTRFAMNTGIVTPRLHKSINSTCSFYIANIIFPKLPHFIRHPTPCTTSTYKNIVNNWLRSMDTIELESYLTSIYT
jgi:hypothetical protein